jgi:hypothetical protein
LARDAAYLNAANEVSKKSTGTNIFIAKKVFLVIGDVEHMIYNELILSFQI